MNSYLNAKFQKLGQERFKLIGPLVSLSADIILIYYATQVLLPSMLTKEVLMRNFHLLGAKGLSLTPDMIEMFKSMAVSSSLLLFGGFFLFNCVIAYNVYKKGNSSILYLKGYTFSTVILSIIEIFTFYFKLSEVNFYTLVTTFMYLFVYLGLRSLFKKEEQQT